MLDHMLGKTASPLAQRPSQATILNIEHDKEHTFSEISMTKFTLNTAHHKIGSASLNH